MPIYEYRCVDCGHTFEKIQSFSATPESVCPKCGGELVRPMTAPALQFKGAGWYINDYSSKGSSSKAAAKGESGDSAKPSGGSSDSTSSSTVSSGDSAKPSSTPAAAPATPAKS